MLTGARTTIFLCVLLGALVGFSGCGGGGGGATTGSTAGTTGGTSGQTTGGTTGQTTGGTTGGSGPAQIQFVHASPDAPRLDFRVDGALAAGNRGYLEISPYQAVTPGRRLLVTTQAGDSVPLLENAEELAAGTRYSYLVVDFFDFLFEPVFLVNNVAGVPAGQARLRFLHAMPSEAFSLFDVYVTAPGADLSTATPVLRDVDFLATTDYVTVPIGARQVRFALAGSTDVFVDSGELTFASGQVRSILAVEQPGSGEPYFTLVVPEN
jgi:hypothetical protein